jgi:hypothetical protein
MTGVSHVFQSVKRANLYANNWFLQAAVLWLPFLAVFATKQPGLLPKICPQPVMPDPRATMKMLQSAMADTGATMNMLRKH